MKNPFKCPQSPNKGDHDFSYKGKKTVSQIHCNNCGINVIDWVNNFNEWNNSKAQEDYDKECEIMHNKYNKWMRE